VASFQICWGRLTDAEKDRAHQDAHAVLDVVASGFEFKTSGDLRSKLDWEIERFGRSMAALHEMGCQLFDFKVTKL
jgi:hypothetical protein